MIQRGILPAEVRTQLAATAATMLGSGLEQVPGLFARAQGLNLGLAAELTGAIALLDNGIGLYSDQAGGPLSRIKHSVAVRGHLNAALFYANLYAQTLATDVDHQKRAHVMAAMREYPAAVHEAQAVAEHDPGAGRTEASAAVDAAQDAVLRV